VAAAAVAGKDWKILLGLSVLLVEREGLVLLLFDSPTPNSKRVDYGSFR
jgi:hypothetical protein